MKGTDPLEPLALSAIHIPDFNTQDWEKQIEDMWRVNCVASEVLSGDRPADDLLAAVESCGVDPDQYLQAALDRLEAAIVNDVMGGLSAGERLAYAR